MSLSNVLPMFVKVICCISVKIFRIYFFDPCVAWQTQQCRDHFVCYGGELFLMWLFYCDSYSFFRSIFSLSVSTLMQRQLAHDARLITVYKSRVGAGAQKGKKQCMLQFADTGMFDWIISASVINKSGEIYRWYITLNSDFYIDCLFYCRFAWHSFRFCWT